MSDLISTSRWEVVCEEGEHTLVLTLEMVEDAVAEAHELVVSKGWHRCTVRQTVSRQATAPK